MLAHAGGAAVTGGPAHENLQRRKPREAGPGERVRRYGDLRADRCFVEAGWSFGKRSGARRIGSPIARGRTELRLGDGTTGDHREQRDGKHGHCRPISGAAEVQHSEAESIVSLTHEVSIRIRMGGERGEQPRCEPLDDDHPAAAAGARRAARDVFLAVGLPHGDGERRAPPPSNCRSRAMLWRGGGWRRGRSGGCGGSRCGSTWSRKRRMNSSAASVMVLSRSRPSA